MLYAAFLGFFVYRELTPKDLWEVLVESVRTTSVVLLLIGCASAFGWMMTYLQIPAKVLGALLGISSNPVVILMIVNVLLLLLGTVMDVAPLIVITTPVLLPVVLAAGMNPVTFGIVLMLNLGIGLTTPPVGAGLFVGCMVGKTSVEGTSRAMIALWPAMIAVLLLATYVPWVTMLLPSLAVR